MKKNNYLDSILAENPFSLKYDLEKMNSFLKKDDLSQQEYETIEFYNYCYNLFKFSYNQIIEIYKLFKSKEELLDFIFKELNRQQISIHKTVFENSLLKDSIALNFERIQFTQIKELNGIKVKEALERSGDILNVLIRILEFVNYENLPKQTMENSEKEDLFLKLYFYASNIYSFNSFCEMIKVQEGTINILNNKIKINIAESFKTINTLNTIADIRNRNHINEYSTYLSIYNGKFNKTTLYSKKITHFNINNGYIENLSINTVKFSEYDTLDFARYCKIEKYKESLKFNFYSNISLKDIFNIILTIEKLVTLILTNKISKIKPDIGYKIRRETLLDAIVKVTEIEKDIVEKVINSITEKNKDPYFWRKPLYEYNDNIYLSYALLNAPNFDLLLDCIIGDNKIDIYEQIFSFRKQIINELSEVSQKYVFKLLELPDKDLKDILIYELRDYYLIIRIGILEEFPITSTEINNSISFLSKLTNDLKFKLMKLKDSLESEKSFIPLLLINYTCFSGWMNEIGVFDLILLKNYFITGNFTRAQSILSDKKVVPKIYNQFNYYNNEDEFNSRFPNFIFNPIPIKEIQNKLIWREQAVLPDTSDFNIYIDVCDYIDEQTKIEDKISILRTSLHHQYYNQINEKEQELYNISIQFHLTDIFYLLAYGKYDLSFYRFELSEIFQKLNISGFANLIIYFRNSLNNLSSLKIKKARTFNDVKYDEKVVIELIDKIIDQNKIIRLSEFEIKLNLTKTEEKQLISLSLNVISTITTKKYNDDEIENHLLFLSILRNFIRKYDIYYEFYSCCYNIIASLNFNNNYQFARNLAEEILLISIKEKKIHKGWEILFVCLEQQKNIFDASIYGCLYITSLTATTHLSYNEFINIFFNILKFSRNIYSEDILDGVFDFLKNYKLKDYDEQKIHLSYYLSVLLNPYTEKNKTKIEESINYVKEKRKKITQYKEKGIIPWLNYFYNIKRLQAEGSFDINISVDEIISFFEKETSEEHFVSIKQKHFTGNGLKSNFIEAVRKSLNTNSYWDYIFENQNLDLDANHLIYEGILKNDIENILLSGFITNDIRLIYNNKYVEPGTLTPFKTKQTDYDYLNYYKEHILDKILLRKNQIMLYLFTSKNHVYGLLINSTKNTKIIKTDEWNLRKMSFWLTNTENFYFNSNKYYDLSEQETSYNQSIEKLDFTDLNIDFEADEILISTNIDLSKFPLNLIVNKDNFLGATKHVSNILLLEWYLYNSKEVIIDSNYTSTCWAPIEDGDPDINYGYDKIKPMLEKNNIKQLTNSFPEKIQSNINIFFAHGELNENGFKAIYKSDKNNSAIISNRNLFGSGDVAILFVCHSGTIEKNLFSNSVVSLVHEIIELGYKAVIAPCWSLEVTIPGFWLDEFFIKFKSGVYISEAVFHANNKLAEYKESISNAYYVPEGRLPMHIYGNPNIKLNL